MTNTNALLTPDEIKQLEHHIRDHEVNCSYSCSLIRRLLDAQREPRPDVMDPRRESTLRDG